MNIHPRLNREQREGLRLARLLQRRGLERTAHDIGVSASQLSLVESGQRSLNPVAHRRLVNVLFEPREDSPADELA